MDPQSVTIIGVFDPDDASECFCYTTNAPTNLYVHCQLPDNSVMHPEFATVGLNRLMFGDLFDEGDSVSLATDAGYSIKFTVSQEVPRLDVSAFQARTQTVRYVMVDVIETPETPVEMESPEDTISTTKPTEGE
jgi:hypothetical protein